MRRFIFASHHRMAYGLKETVAFLTNGSKKIHDINAYTANEEPDLEVTINNLFSNFSPEDEVIVLTDLMGGSVYQKFYPYMNDRVHIICGMNLPLAMSLLLVPEKEILDKERISSIVEECRKQIIYVNQLDTAVDYDDE